MIMKKISAVLLCAMLVLLTNACTKKEYDSFGNIAGSVYDVDTKTLVEGVTITLTPSSKNTYTGSAGQFEFHDIEAGQYKVHAQKGDKYNSVNVNVNPGETTSVDIVLVIPR